MNITSKFPLLIAVVILVFFTWYALAKSTTEPEPKAIDQTNTVGKVTNITGEVSDHHGNQLQQDSPISMGVTITTKANSKVSFTMIDNAVIILGENSALTISEYHYQANGKENSVVMKILDGIFRTVSGAVGKNESDKYQVTTPCLLNIGIQGTDYQVNFKDNKESISAHKGVIVVEKASLFGPPKQGLFGDQQKERYITIKKPTKGTRATGSKWKTFSNTNKPNDFPPPLEM